MAGVDAHAKLELRDADPGDNRFSIPLPSYEASFQMLSVHVRPDAPLSGDAAADAALVMRAIRAGHLYMAIDGLASPPSFEFSATNALGTARGGRRARRRRARHAPGSQQRAARIHDDRLAGQPGIGVAGSGRAQRAHGRGGAEPAVYRAEIRTGDADAPQTWLLSNAIYVRAPDAAQPPARSRPATTQDARSSTARPRLDGTSKPTRRRWPRWMSRKSLTGSELRVRYGLADDATGSQWAALVWGTPIGQPPVNVAKYDRLTFTARADRPMRISVQLRTLDEAGRETLAAIGVPRHFDRQHTVYFNDFMPSAGTEPATPPLEEVTQILFVVDTTNTKPATSGRSGSRARLFEK